MSQCLRLASCWLILETVTGDSKAVTDPLTRQKKHPFKVWHATAHGKQPKLRKLFGVCLKSV